MPALDPAYVDALLRTVNTADFPSHIGFRLAAIGEDSCRVELAIGKPHFQPFGIVHGGVLATLIDTATFWAGFARLPEDAGLVNVDLKLNYLKAVTGGTLVAEGRCLRAGRQLSYTEAHVYDERRELVAHGTSTLMALPGKGLRLGVGKFVVK
ncbi:MAG: PaaI family thioesterase [Pseudomonadota bacterium]